MLQYPLRETVLPNILLEKGLHMNHETCQHFIKRHSPDVQVENWIINTTYCPTLVE